MTETSTQTLPPETASDDQFLLAYLESHEANCPACGYNCHKLLQPRCPECAITLTLRLISLNPIKKSWGVAMVAAGLAAGVGMLLSFLIADRGLSLLRDILRHTTDVVMFSYFLAMIPGSVLLLIFRRRFERLPRPARIAIAALLLSLSLFMLLCLAREH